MDLWSRTGLVNKMLLSIFTLSNYEWNHEVVLVSRFRLNLVNFRMWNHFFYLLDNILSQTLHIRTWLCLPSHTNNSNVVIAKTKKKKNRKLWKIFFLLWSTIFFPPVFAWWISQRLSNTEKFRLVSKQKCVTSLQNQQWINII